MDLLNDDEFESTMMMLDNAGSIYSTSSPIAFRREDADNLELNLAALGDVFGAQEAERLFATCAQGNSLRPHLKGSGRTPVASNKHDDVFIKQEPVKANFSPTMASFLRESFDGVDGPSMQSALKSRSACSSPFTIAFTPGRVNSLPLSLFLPNPSPMNSQPLPKVMPYSALPLPPATLRSVSNTSNVSTSSSVSSASSTRSKGTRRAKQCVSEGCTRRAQSNNRCKTHGGGARCQAEGCDKSSQGGGLCRAHGGGKKCSVEGCTKGTQRLGLCYLHGGIRRCIMDGCKKKDRGNGYCISHGGGRRCEADNCNRCWCSATYASIRQFAMSDSQAFSDVAVHALRVLVFLVLNYALASTSFMVVLFGVALSLGSVALCCLGVVVFQGLLYLAPLLMRLDVALHNFVEPVERKLYGQIAHYGESESSMARPSLAVLLYFSTAKLGVGVLSAMVVIIPFSMPIHAMTSPLFRDEYFNQGWFNFAAFIVVATILLVSGFVAMPHVAKLSCVTTRMVCREVFPSIYMHEYVPVVPHTEPSYGTKQPGEQV
ncbi:hypothetical protein PHYBOEH_010877 [Phytophthora boehmeriae]|uniref:WRKY19-like zinc finger domain-containing protein n=1 Tax=Phytophthora boehmeriae TaxID=109152 RepID=A0A8T1VN20_9STRA|nr:hypothetical protein PHYBOEH_010877 [Phytophthora boehmeriae]